MRVSSLDRARLFPLRRHRGRKWNSSEEYRVLSLGNKQTTQSGLCESIFVEPLRAQQGQHVYPPPSGSPVTERLLLFASHL